MREIVLAFGLPVFSLYHHFTLIGLIHVLPSMLLIIERSHLSEVPAIKLEEANGFSLAHGSVDLCS